MDAIEKRLILAALAAGGIGNATVTGRSRHSEPEIQTFNPFIPDRRMPVLETDFDPLERRVIAASGFDRILDLEGPLFARFPLRRFNEPTPLIMGGRSTCHREGDGTSYKSQERKRQKAARRKNRKK
jgi:hypothetical protein